MAAVLVPLALIAGDYVIHGKAFAFADIGSDTFFSFYPQQLEIARQLQEMGTFGWSFHLGLGGFLGNLFDPTWLLTGWLPLDWQLGLRLPVFLAKTMTAGGFMFAYLRLVGFEIRLAALGALCYALCDYAMINAQWEIIHGTEFVQFPAFLYLVERYFRTGSHLPAVLAGVVVGVGNPFGLYTFAFFTALYLSVRFLIVIKIQLRSALMQSVRFASWCLIGLAITAPLLLPATLHFIDNPRVSGSHSMLHDLLHQILAINDRVAFSSQVGGLLGKNFFGIGDAYRGWGNYLEGPSFYIGLLPLIMIPQLASQNASRTERRLFWLTVIGATAYILFPVLRYATFAFGHIGFRFSTLWISVAILATGLLGLRRGLLSGFNTPALLAGMLGCAALAAAGVWLSPMTTNHGYAITVIGFALAYAFVLLVVRRRLSPALHLPALLALCMLEFALQSIPSVTHRVNVLVNGTSPTGSYLEGLEALDTVRANDRSTEFYRIMKASPAVFLNDPLAQGYAGTMSYYFHDRSITRFVDKIGIPRPSLSPNYISEPVCCRDVADMLAVRYVLARAGEALPFSMPLELSTGGWSVYRNTTEQPFGFFATAIVDEALADALPAGERQRLARAAAIVGLHDDTPASLGQVTTSAAASVASVRVARSNALRGTAIAQDHHLLILAMPYDPGWKARIGGEPAYVFPVNYGLTGLLVPPGEHVLALDHQPRGRAAGILVSGLALLALLLNLSFQFWTRRAHGASRQVRPL